MGMASALHDFERRLILTQIAVRSSYLASFPAILMLKESQKKLASGELFLAFFRVFRARTSTKNPIKKHTENGCVIPDWLNLAWSLGVKTHEMLATSSKISHRMNLGASTLTPTALESPLPVVCFLLTGRFGAIGARSQTLTHLPTD